MSFREESILLSRVGDTEKILLLTVSGSLNQAAALNLRRMVTDHLLESGTPDFEATLEATNEVLLGLLIDGKEGRLLERYERFVEVSVLRPDDDLVEIVRDLFLVNGPARGLNFHHRDARSIEIRRAEIVTPTRTLLRARLNFDPEHLSTEAQALS